MRKEILDQLRERNPFLVTKSNASYKIFDQEGAGDTRFSYFPNEIEHYIAESQVPFIDFTPALRSPDILGIPGASELVRPPPYSPQDFAPVELVAAVCASCGCTVKNIPSYVIPDRLLRAVSDDGSTLRNVETIKLNFGSSNDAALNELVAWGLNVQEAAASSIRRIMEEKLTRSEEAVEYGLAVANHRAFGVVHYYSVMSETGNYPGSDAWVRTEKALSKWVDFEKRFADPSDDLPPLINRLSQLLKSVEGVTAGRNRTPTDNAPSP